MANIEGYIETGDNINTLSYLRDRTQKLMDRKREYILTAVSETLSTNDCEDAFKVSKAYKEAVDQNSKLLDIIRDTKDEMLFLRLAKERIDTSTQLGQQQLKQVDNLVKVLAEIVSILDIEKIKMDRFVRFYERTFNYYGAF